VSFSALVPYTRILPEGLPLRPNSFYKLLPVIPTLLLLCHHLGTGLLLLLRQRRENSHCIRRAIEFLGDGGRGVCLWCEGIVFGTQLAHLGNVLFGEMCLWTGGWGAFP
jgi:hypothetical protein